MPRKAKPPQANLPRVRKELHAYLLSVGTTPTALSAKFGVNQSTVQRFLAARTKTITPKIRPLLEYANIDLEMRITDKAHAVAENPRIRRALEKVWDGEEYTAEILATLIESIGPVITQVSQGRGS